MSSARLVTTTTSVVSTDDPTVRAALRELVSAHGDRFFPQHLRALSSPAALNDSPSDGSMKARVAKFVSGHIDQIVQLRIAAAKRALEPPAEQPTARHAQLLGRLQVPLLDSRETRGMSMDQLLLANRDYHNPAVREALLTLHVMDATHHSFLVQRSLPAESYYEAVRDKQDRGWADEVAAEGVRLFRASREKDAMGKYRAALDIDPGNAVALVARGAAHANRHEFNEAIRDFRRALERDRAHEDARAYLIDVLIERGLAHKRRKDYEKALDDFESVVSLDGEHAIGRMQRDAVRETLEGTRREAQRNMEMLQLMSASYRKSGAVVNAQKSRGEKKKEVEETEGDGSRRDKREREEEMERDERDRKRRKKRKKDKHK